MLGTVGTISSVVFRFGTAIKAVEKNILQIVFCLHKVVTIFIMNMTF